MVAGNDAPLAVLQHYASARNDAVHFVTATGMRFLSFFGEVIFHSRLSVFRLVFFTSFIHDTNVVVLDQAAIS